APSPPVRIRRALPSERARVLELDAAAFLPFWQLDERGLDDAIEATPRARFAVAVDGESGRIEGYAVTGRSGRNGYLQRLTVDPAAAGPAAAGPRIRLVSQTAWIRPGADLKLVVGTTDVADPTALDVVMSVFPPVTSRADLSASFTGDGLKSAIWQLPGGPV